MPSLEKLSKLVEAEYLVPEINARIDEQRQVVENLATQGHDIASAKIVLDSLLMSFFCVSRSGSGSERRNSKDKAPKPHDRRANFWGIAQIQMSRNLPRHSAFFCEAQTI